MRKISLCSILFYLAFYVIAEQPSEATTLLSYNIFNENDLYMSLEGSWKFELSTFSEGNISTAFENLIFIQVPDLDASLWLFNHYFFEVKISKNSDENLFILGYQNSNGLLKEVRIGNDDLNIGSYADFTPSLNINRSPGARIKIANSVSEHEILTRYTSEINNSIHYIGYNSVEEETISINKYIKGSFFVLPFKDFNNLDIYTNDNENFTVVSKQDFIHYSEQNLLYVDHDNNSIYLSLGTRKKDNYKNILYEFINPSKNPGILHSSNPEKLWDEYVENINGQTYLKIYTPGIFSPFAHLGCYELKELTDSVNKDIELSLNNIKIINYLLKDNIVILHDSSLSYNDLTNRYPFIAIDNDIYSPEGYGLNSEYGIKFSSLTPVTNITVPIEAKENSLSILINGISYNSFTHSSKTGNISFKKEISPLDDILINYKTELIPGTGNLLLSYGSRYKLGENLTMDFSHTASWDFSSDDFSYEANENTGSLVSRGLLSYKSKLFSTEFKSSLYANNPDTLNKYLLFQYDKSEINIPINSTLLDLEYNNGIPLIKRVYNDLLLTLDGILKLPIDESGGAYIVKHIEMKNSSEVIVMENVTLEENEFSSTNINLNDYQDDYSWATGFSVNILNYGEMRDIQFRFINKNQETKNNLIKTIELTGGTNYTEYNIQFSRSERAKLTNIDSIEILVFKSDSSILLLKNIKFSGNTLITHGGTREVYVTESGSNITIKTATDNISEGNIEISSRISPINIKKYSKMNFNLFNSGLITDSTITLELIRNGEIVGSLVLPPKFTSGNNNVVVDTENGIVTINGFIIENSEWYSTNIESNSFRLNIENCNSGSVTVSEIVLSEPIWEFYNENSLKIKFTPDLSINIGEFSIIDNVVLTIENNVINNNTISYNGMGDISLDLLGVNISSTIYFNQVINRLEYKIIIPSKKSPIELIDLFSYDTNRFRSNSFNYNIDSFELNLKLTDSLGEEKGFRDSTLKATIGDSSPILLTSDTNLTQSRKDQLGSINFEIINSYQSLLPQNTIHIKNVLSEDLKLSLDYRDFNLTTKISSELQQTEIPKKIDINSYGLSISSGINIFNFTLSPAITSSYVFTNKVSDIKNINGGIINYISIFADSNPYKTLNIIDILFSTNRSDFYNHSSIENNRMLSSTTSLKLEHLITCNNIVNIFIPNAITISFNKDYTQEESKEVSTLIRSITGDFTISPIIKNSLTLSRILNIEEEETENSLNWELVFYKELSKDVFLSGTNILTIFDDENTNLAKTELTWPGKSGPLLIIPLFNKVLDSPYNYKHSEIIYMSSSEDWKVLKFGLRHETILTVKDMNETNLYIDFIYNNDSNNRLSFELGLFTTLIF